MADSGGRAEDTGSSDPFAAWERPFEVARASPGPLRALEVGASAGLAHALYAAIVENSEDAIVTKDLNGVVLSWNDAARRIFGYEAQEMIGQGIERLIPPDRLDEETMILGRIRRGERVEHYETKRRRKDGTLIDVALTVSPVRDASGRVVGASKIARDVTAQKATEARLRDLARQRETEFARMFLAAAHELNAPLTPLLLQVEMLRSPEAGPLTERQARTVAVVERNLQRLAAMVRTMLEIASLDTGRPMTERERVDLAGLLRDALETHARVAARAGLRLRLEGLPRPCPVIGHAGRLAQLFANLLSNALRHTPPGGEVVLRLTEESDQYRVSVTDTGGGIAVADQARLFHAYLPSASSPPGDAAAAGIGLYVARLIAEAHGGQIEVFSAGPGQGAAFSVLLPRARSLE